MNLVRNPLCDKLADHRVLGTLAIFFFVAPVVMAIRESSAHAGASPGRPVPARSAPGTAGRKASGAMAYVEDREAMGSPEGLLEEVKQALAPAPELPETPKEVPGDFLTDLSAAFEEGEASGLVRCRTQDEMRVFRLWREALNGRGITENVTLRRIEQHPDGIEQYQIAIKGTEVQGWITFKQHQNRWYVVGVKQKKREKTEAELDEELYKLLDTLKLQGSPQDLRGPQASPPPGER